MERWKPIPGYEGLYSASNLGRIRAEQKTSAHAKVGNITRKRQFMSLQDDCQKGYLKVRLRKDGKFVTKRVCRLVASTFLGPCVGGQQVNHKNGIKTDDRVCNLEWCTQSENIRHAHALGLCAMPRGAAHHHARAVAMFNVNTGKLERVFDTVTSACHHVNGSNANIIACAKGKLKTSYGHIWKYKGEK